MDAEHRQPEFGDEPTTEVLLPPTLVLGWTVNFCSDITSPLVTVDQASRQLTINQLRCESESEARRIGTLAAARQRATSLLFRSVDPATGTKILSENPVALHDLLTLAGARLLAEDALELAKQVAVAAPPASSLVAEFRAACASYLITGHFPPASPAVQKALAALPTNPATHDNLLSDLTSPSNAFSLKVGWHKQFMADQLTILENIDKALKAATSDEFQPSTDSSSKEALNEADIKQRIDPYTGGYLREQVFDDVNWEAMTVQATGVRSQRLLPSPFAPTPKQKQHTFSGTNGGDLSVSPLSLPLSASARVDAATLPSGFSIRQTVNGTYTLEWSGLGEPPEQYQFIFTRSAETPSWQTAEPTEAEQGIPTTVIGTLSSDTQAFIESLRDAKLTDAARVSQVVKRVQDTITYVNDSAVGLALKAAGSDYFAELERIKQGDCDVANFYALAQLRALGIPCRMVIGYFIKRDRRFDFAALAGSKHAWLEWWNSASGIWQRTDATPPDRSERDEEDGDEENGSGGDQLSVSDDEAFDDREPDEDDSDPWSLPLDEAGIDRLKSIISELESQGLGDAAAETKRAAATFKHTYGVSKEQWQPVHELAKEISSERIPAAKTVDGKEDSTVQREWERILELLLVAYRKLEPGRRLWVRQNQGGILADPVTAAVGFMTGDDNPPGWQLKIAKEKTVELPIRFGNDFLLDVTGSMQAKGSDGLTLLEQQRRFVLSALYQSYRLNERVKGAIDELRDEPLLTHHVLTIHGSPTWSEILKNQPLTLAELVAVDEAIKKPITGPGPLAEALAHYANTVAEDQSTVTQLRGGKMVKTLTIISDGNLYCDMCQKESCRYELNGPTLQSIRGSLAQLKQLGVWVNAIGFSRQSREIIDVLGSQDDARQAVVVDNLAEALAQHHAQVQRAMTPALKVAHNLTRGVT